MWGGRPKSIFNHRERILSPRHRDSPIAFGKQIIKQPTRARVIPQLDHVDKLNRNACLTDIWCQCEGLPEAEFFVMNLDEVIVSVSEFPDVEGRKDNAPLERKEESGRTTMSNT